MRKSALFLTAALAWASTTLPSLYGHDAQSNEGTRAPAAGKLSKPDLNFANESARGGLLEVELGKLAQEKAVDAEVKRFGQTMVQDHGKANQELQQWASQAGVTLPSGLTDKGMKLKEQLGKASGAEFDRRYVEAMVKDHDHDVPMFQRQGDKGDNPELRAWAKKTVPTLQGHQQMAHELQTKLQRGQ